MTAEDEPIDTPSDPAPLAGEPGGADDGSRPTGVSVIGSYLKTLTAQPGVYRMIDAQGEVLYVGKAKSLKARVASYARVTGHSNRITRMIAATASMEFVTVRTEAEALLLEANLIKRFRPPFNVLLRDDKSFPYILIARDHPAPQLVKHRGARTRKGSYFGPFASPGAVSRTMTILQRAFHLRTCTDSVYESRTRPCLLFQIKRCSGPCTGEISHDDYGRLVADACRFLRGDAGELRAQYQRQMEEAAEKLEFELAAEYRNRLWAMAHVMANQAINPEGIEEADILAAHQDGGQTCIEVFFFRTGQNWGNRAYFPRADRSLDAAEVLDAFIAQFYDDKPVPRLILLSHDIESREVLAEALSSKAERRVEIRVPQRGTKSTLVEHALQNAKDALSRRLAETSSQAELLRAMADRLRLPQTPRRIEVFDNSHISGTNAVGAMIVAGPEGYAKGQYRKFNIKSAELTPGDDYAMMREVLTRRLSRIAERDREIAEREAASALAAASTAPAEVDAVADTAGEDAAQDTDLPERPDVLLIDGGAGQLAVAREVMESLKLTDITLIGVAKGPDRDAGREHFHMLDRSRPFMLEPRDPVLFFIQRLRDEAHRFAIMTHRARRTKALAANPLSDIAGIGPTRKRALLQHFGSAKAVSRAGIEDLKAVPGISAEMARKIYEHFHETPA